MKAIKRPVDTFYCVPICEKCGSDMVKTGHTLTSHPPQHQYICTSTECSHVDFHTKDMPYVEYSLKTDKMEATDAED